ncbi:unnamed protein product, partial [Ixodes hexagonus]
QFLAVILVVPLWPSAAEARYEPTWDSLDSRPLPAWYDEAKVGIFLHWGVYSVPSYVSEWFWWYWMDQGFPTNKKVPQFMKDNYPPGFTYPAFAKDFTCEFFDPSEWARIFEDSGARYVVLTSKHHEGYTLWPSNGSFNWNSMDVGPKRDLVGELANAIRAKTDLVFGVYHSLFEWFNPLYRLDKSNNFTSDFFAQLFALAVCSHMVSISLSDGPWESWRYTECIAFTCERRPVKDTVVTNDRWGDGCVCKHGGYFTCDDRYNPGVLQPHKWENCMTVDQYSWGYRRNASLSDILTIERLIATVVETISCGGNILINVGPTHDGRIAPIFQERLAQLGSWLRVNGEAVYGSEAWLCQNDTLSGSVWYEHSWKLYGNRRAVYAFVLEWPRGNVLALGSLKIGNDTKIVMLGAESEPVTVLSWSETELFLKLPALTPDLLPSPWAWVLRVTGTAKGDCII